MKRLLPLLVLLLAVLSPVTRAQARVMEIVVLAAESGEPIAGAELTGRLGEEREARKTDAAGRCEVLLPAEAVRIDLRLHAPGRVPVRAVWSAAEAAPGALPAATEARMPAGVEAGGRVTSPGGGPVAGAEVEVTAAPESAEDGPWRPALKRKTFETDADGRWSSDAFPADLAAVRLEVRHPSYRTLAAVQPAAGGTQTEMVEKLPVRGTAVDPDGRPVPFASVYVGFSSYDSDWAGVAADAEGRFALGVSEPGPTRLLVEGEGLAPAKRDVEVGPEGLEVGEVRLEPGHAIGGRVVDGGGAPRAGVEVALSRWEHQQLLRWSTRTDADGRWAWEHAPRSDDLNFYLSADGLSRANLDAKAPHAEPYEVVMRPEIVVSGRVTDAATGEPVAAFTARHAFYFRSDDDRRTRIEHQSEDFRDGDYRIALNHAYDRVAVDIEAPGYRTAASPGYAVNSEQRNHTFDVALRKDEGFTGRVVDAAGDPVAGAEVWFEEAGEQIQVTNGRVGVQPDQPGPLVSDAEGRFSGPTPAPGFVLLAIADAGWCWAGPDAAASGADLTLEPWARLEGRIFRGREPAAGAKPWMSRGMEEHGEFGYRLYFRQEHEADAAGRFSADRIRAGEVGVAVRVPISDTAHSGTQWTDVELVPGETARVQLGGRGRPVTGRILIPDAVPPDDDEYGFGTSASFDRVRKEAGLPHRIAAPFGEDGVFHVADVPPGNYLLRYQRLGYPQGRRDAGHVVVYVDVESSFTVPPMDEPVSDEPLDLGDLPVTVFPENLPPSEAEPAPEAAQAEAPPAADAPAAPPVGPLPGLTAPPIALDLFDAEGRFDLAAHRGNFVVLDFWATWCGPCVKALPELEALHAEQDPGRVAFLSLSLDRDEEALRAFLQDRPSPWPQAHAGAWGDAPLAEAYAVRAVPTLVLIGPNGRILHRGHGVRELAVALREAVGINPH